MTEAWEEPWARLRAFRQHLPEHHEIREDFIQTYHDLLAELEQTTGCNLQNFRVPESAIRPKVVSAIYGTRGRPGRVNYSQDRFCERTNLLMKLDGLIPFLEPRLQPSSRSAIPVVGSGPLLPYEMLSLTLYRFIESGGKSQWRPTSLGDLYTVTQADQALLVDEMKRLHAEQFLGIRKWFEGVNTFVPYIDDTGADEKFFYRDGFELKVLPRGRPWFQLLEHRAAELHELAGQSLESVGRSSNEGADQNRITGESSTLRDPTRLPKAFISYSWDKSEPHKEWVRALASRLRTNGVDVTLDYWHLQPGDQLTKFMETAVRENDFVLIVCTPGYRARSDQRQGGVGYEGDIMTAEVYAKANHRKFIPLLRVGEWSEAAPSWLVGKNYLDFRGDPYPSDSYNRLLKTLHGAVEAPPPVGPRPDFLSMTSSEAFSLTPDRGSSDLSFEDHYRMAREALEKLGSKYYRRVDLISITPLDISVARLWEAAKQAQAEAGGAQTNRPWPLVFHFFGHETKRKIHPWGFTAEFTQPMERFGPNYEFVAAQETGCLRVLETKGLLMAGSDVFYYDRAIGSALDVLDFAGRFFRKIGLGEANEISIRLEWGGLEGRHIGGEQMSRDYEQRISQTDVVTSEIRFRLADAEKDVPGRIEKLLTRVFNQFGMFHPKSEIYRQVIEAWKSGQ